MIHYLKTLLRSATNLPYSNKNLVTNNIGCNVGKKAHLTLVNTLARLLMGFLDEQLWDDGAVVSSDVDVVQAAVNDGRPVRYVHSVTSETELLRALVFHPDDVLDRFVNWLAMLWVMVFFLNALIIFICLFTNLIQCPRTIPPPPSQP